VFKTSTYNQPFLVLSRIALIFSRSFFPFIINLIFRFNVIKNIFFKFLNKKTSLHNSGIKENFTRFRRGRYNV
jgi:hypothetical protein